MRGRNTRVIERFHIEDIVVQDSSGVLYRAVDTRTGQAVALRRLFPNGPEGGGLNAGEQAAYQAAVDRLASIAHPALRSILCGGCDPVDGMPFIATEWIEGNRLQAFLDHGPLKAEEAADLLAKALEVGELVAKVLGEEGVWIETGPNTIVIGGDGSGRGVTFWISPLKWLNRSQGQGLEAIAALTEIVMDWQGKAMTDQAGRGLGGWLKWLKADGRAATLEQARERLAASAGAEPPVPATNLVRQAQATRKVVAATKMAGTVKKPKKSSGVPTALAGVLFLAVVAGTGWYFVHKNSQDVAKEEAAQATSLNKDAPVIITKDGTPPSNTAEAGAIASLPDKPDETSTLSTSSELAKPSAQESVPAARENSPPPVAATETKEGVSPDGKVYAPADRELIAARKGETITLEGSFEKIGYSKSRKTMYVLFSSNPSTSEPRGAISTGRIPAGLSESELEPLVGKKIRLQGTVRMEGPDRPVIDLEKRSAIIVLE